LAHHSTFPSIFGGGVIRSFLSQLAARILRVLAQHDNGAV
jgi:hypothetical protein